MASLDFDLFVILFFLGGWLGARLIRAAGLPSILGMVLFGIALGTVARDAIPEKAWDLAPLMTSLALIVILLRAGLGIRRSTLVQVGRPAVLLGFVPCLAEAAVLTPLFMWLFDFPLLVAVMASFILAAVSPAVVIPAMLTLRDAGYGQRSNVPTMILAGASLDDVVAITFFTVHLQQAVRLMETGADLRATDLSAGMDVLGRIPLSIGGGLLVGGLLGLVLAWAFGLWYRQIRATEKTLVLLMLALLVLSVGEATGFAALLAVMTVGFVLLARRETVANELSAKLGKVWVAAEIVLFVYIGMAMELGVAVAAGWKGLALIAAGLAARSVGVLVSLLLGGVRHSWGERWFCVLAYLPKATVQAALGSVPLAAGIPGGEIILAIAVLAIVVTAPLGMLAIRHAGPRLLDPPPGGPPAAT